ncbi:adenylosuccinate synthase [Companilactobacillus sp.]|jgi:adenylosuccinate synthase|uniref:adenylosuccinate synthase n=1 Tax=Companilactobacillus sp. TaxID=2767905 RepID=UPI0025C0E3F3|nr:adenylosuccinate synthase [Companilactobacillus sp.]MCH4009468.1 adenylosuccinate synthase [Companilactobacillus sp.]MCH4050353.1 adenylosuccinate synthase [Companilactobacillus sp.]MCH4077410.1 adenylosuccinate synthase [Companilactobacillus sp.]MCH4125986.1 adenylosuccinate synthase [Companilactobacillus sp.]MCI1311695.1 adenylosuccinate synthase [Companilactobacillus sp.]
MTTVVVVGTQWGDEGKGKITDYFSGEANIIARYQGGDNAGHTLNIDGNVYKLRSVPSGILYSDKVSIIGNGVVLNIESLLEELKRLHEQGVDTSNLRISNRAHLIMPYHIQLDKLQEASKGDSKVGTTNRGIGPTYMDKSARVGIRMADILDKELFRDLLKSNLDAKNELFTKIYNAEPMSFDDMFEKYYELGQQLKDRVIDTSAYLNKELKAGKNVLFEGAQGIMLDIDHGTYPYVTSSNPAGGVTTGAGVGAPLIDKVIGVVKAYTSRVGAGPFPTEQDNETGDFLREAGHEYGTVTHRPRRVGWLDTVVLKHSCNVSGVTHLSLNCLDVLTGLKEIKVCVGYDYNGKQIDEYPANLNMLAKCKPVYKTFNGWDEDITQAKSIDELPDAAKAYLEFLKEELDVEYATVSVGPDRDQTIIVNDVWK